MSLADVANEFGRVYAATQPPGLAESGARWALATSSYMIVRGSPAGVADDWVYLAELLARMAAAYREAPGRRTPRPDRCLVDGADQIYTLDYRALGTVVPERFVTRLHRATFTVEEALLGERSNNPLTEDEIVLLRGLAAGKSICDLAADLGYSERSISRCLRRIWQRIGATSRAEGIATVTAHGWLEVSPLSPPSGSARSPAAVPTTR